MIAFVSLFLGLITGQYTVAVAVSGSVAAVEIRLDGEKVGVIDGEPWKLEVDFGPELSTHELSAVAHDARGVAVDSATQLINVPRPAVEAELLLDDWQGGVPRRGRVIWHAMERIEPAAVELGLDGRPLAVESGESFELPPLAAGSLHFLSARIELPDGTTSTAEAIVGGAFGSTVRSELTAVPLFVDGKAGKLADVQGRLLEGGEALDVVALEDGTAEVILVRDEEARDQLYRLSVTLWRNLDDGYRWVGVEASDAVRLMSAQPRKIAHPHLNYTIFPRSEPLTVRDAPLPDLLSSLEFDQIAAGPQLLVDAVAVAGLQAAASQKRRAVVLVVADCAAVRGRWGVETVRAYLTELRVPLHVWSVEPLSGREAGGFCAGAEDVSVGRKMLKAVKRLRRTVKRQQIAWVDGRYLPREIALSPGAEGVRLVE